MKGESDKNEKRFKKYDISNLAMNYKGLFL